MKDLRRHAYKPPFSMERGLVSEDRIDKIERNLIDDINARIRLSQEVNDNLNHIYALINRD